MKPRILGLYMLFPTALLVFWFSAAPAFSQVARPSDRGEDHDMVYRGEQRGQWGGTAYRLPPTAYFPPPTAHRPPPTEYSYNLERALLKGFGVYASGLLDGISETLIWHYPAFQRVHPNANPQYWNPYESWVNKYKNGDPTQGAAFPGSTTWLAWSTDGYHATRTGSRFFLFGSITISIFEKRRKWWTYPAEFVAGGLIRSAGFHSTYSLYSQYNR